MSIGIGQTSHLVTSQLTIWSAGYKVRSITPLEEEQALRTGAEFIRESFILLVSGGWLVWEYSRFKVCNRLRHFRSFRRLIESVCLVGANKIFFISPFSSAVVVAVVVGATASSGLFRSSIK